MVALKTDDVFPMVAKRAARIVAAARAPGMRRRASAADERPSTSRERLHRSMSCGTPALHELGFARESNEDLTQGRRAHRYFGGWWKAPRELGVDVRARWRKLYRSLHRSTDNQFSARYSTSAPFAGSVTSTRLKRW